MLRRLGMTIVELLVVLLVIGVVVAFLLPATQSARESVRTAEQEQKSNPRGDAKSSSAMARPRAAISDAHAKGRPEGEQAATGLPQKIIYEAQITLVVEDIAALETQLAELVKQYGGYVADAAVNRQHGTQVSGSWRIRIPVGEFDSFLDAAAKLGVTEHRRQAAQDVTEEYVDLEARIANKQRLEARIVTLLESSSGSIRDALEAERELARVRSEIEQMEGRRRYLTNRAELSTVTILASEKRDYVPPEAPTFSARVNQAWVGSLLGLRGFAERVAIATVSAFPWIVVTSVLLVPTIWYVGKRFSAIRKSTSAHSGQP